MNIRRGVLSAGLLWISTLIIGLIIIFLVDLFYNEGISNFVYNLSSIIILGVALIYFTWFYFKKDKNVNVKRALYLGGTFFLIGTCLDLMFIGIFALFGGAIQEFAYYYTSWIFLVNLVMIFLIPVLFVVFRKKKRLK